VMGIDPSVVTEESRLRGAGRAAEAADADAAADAAEPIERPSVRSAPAEPFVLPDSLLEHPESKMIAISEAGRTRAVCHDELAIGVNLRDARARPCTAAQATTVASGASGVGWLA
jgi:hypothetical protein